MFNGCYLGHAAKGNSYAKDTKFQFFCQFLWPKFCQQIGLVEKSIGKITDNHQFMTPSTKESHSFFSEIHWYFSSFSSNGYKMQTKHLGKARF